MIQLELQDKLRDDLAMYYERQENAFDQLSTEDLEDYGIREDSKAIQMLKLTQTFLLTDGQISRLSEMKRVFEDDRVYEQVFRPARLKADLRHIVFVTRPNDEFASLPTRSNRRDKTNTGSFRERAVCCGRCCVRGF